MPAYKAHNLPMDIVHNIVDAVHDGFANSAEYPADPFKRFIAEFTSLQLLNKHWCTALTMHPAYTTYQYGSTNDFWRDPRPHAEKKQYLEQENAKLRSWLQVPRRRNRVIHRLSLYIKEDVYTNILRHDFERNYKDATFKCIVFNIFPTNTGFPRYTTNEFRFKLPRSLKAQAISVDLNESGDIVWSSFGHYTRSNTISLSVEVFKKLSNLSITLPNLSYDYKAFLLAHPNVTHLDITLDGPMNLKPLVLGGLDHIQSLKSTNFPLDVGRTYLPSLKQLVVDCIWLPLMDWVDFPTSVEKLHIHNYRVDQGRDLFAKFGELDNINDGHFLLNPAQLHKLDNLKVLEINNVQSNNLMKKFNDGVWDTAMPHLEVLRLEVDGIAQEAVERFARKHPRLRSVMYGAEFVEGDWDVEPYVKGPSQAVRCR